MIYLIIFSLIALGIFLILISHINISVVFDDVKHAFFLKWFIFKFNPLKEKKPKKPKKAKKEKKPEKEPDAEQPKKNDLKKTFKLVKELLTATKPNIKKLLKKVKLKLELKISVATGDAAKTGILYGQISAAAGILHPVVCGIFTVTNQNIIIEPDFYGDNIKINSRIKAKVRVFTLVAFAVKTLKNYVVK